MKKLIGIYIVLIVLISLFALSNVNFYPAFLIQLPFTSFLHKVFESLTTLLFILIFWKANKLYSQTRDERIAVVAGSFLAAGFLNVYHLSSTFGSLYNVLTLENIERQPALIYLLAEKLIIPISIFIAIFYTQKSFEKNLEKFRIKTYFLYFSIFISIIIFDQFIFPFLNEYVFRKVILLEQNLSIIDESFYLLTALFLTDKRLTDNKSVFCIFTLGLLVLGVSELFDINPTFMAINEIISHSLKVIGFLFIFLGVEDFKSLSGIKSIKQKTLAYLSLFLITLYLTFSFFISTITEFNLPQNFPYIFIEFLLVSAIIGYILTEKFTLPLSNIIQIMNKYEPGEKSEKIQIISDDEIGVLSEKLNEIIDREWAYSQKTLETQTKIQELLNKEQLLFKVTTTIRSSLDINETFSIICAEIAKVFNVERSAIVEFPNKNDYKKWLTRREFKSKENIKGLSDVDYDIRTGEYNGIFVVDQGKNLIINNLQKSDTPDYYKKTYGLMEVKSILSVPIRRDEDKWGLIFLSEYENYREWKEDEITLLQTIADQIYIAIKQAALFETVKQTAEKENLLRKIIETIRSTLDINETKKILVTEIGKALNADRVMLVGFDPETNTPLVLDKYSEYLASPDMVSYIGFDFSSPKVDFFSNIHKQTKTIVVPDFQDFIKENDLENTPAAEWILESEIKTGIGISIFYGKKIYGVLSIHYTKNKVPINDAQMDFLRTIGDQAGIALYQAKLFENIKHGAERENLLREIIETIRITLDIKEVKRNIVNKLGKVFNADRCYFRSFDKKSNKFLPPDVEYLSSPDIKSLLNIEPDQEGLRFFYDEIKKQEKVSEPLIADIDSIKNPLVEKYLKNAGILVDYAIPIWDREDDLTYLVLHYATKKPDLQKEDLDLMETVAKQITIAIDQAKFFETIKEQAEREALLRKIVETIRNTLDINEIEKQVVIGFGQTFDANRCFIIEYDQNSNKFLIVKDEYLSSSNVKSFIGLDIEKEAPNLSALAKTGVEVIVEDKDKTILENNLQNTAEEKYLINYNIESGFSVPIYYSDKLLGVLGIHYTTRKGAFSYEQVQLARTLANQVGIAIDQARLYDSIKKLAFNERTLREIISEIKVSQTFDEVYDYIIKKLADIFDAERAFFVEIPALKNEKPTLEHQHRKQIDIPFIPEHMLQEKCLMNLIDTANKKGIAIINNTAEYNKDDEKLQNFFKTFNIKSILLVPLIRYNHDIKLLGALVLCLNKTKDWSEDEINLIKSIAGSTVTVVWEIKKRIELEELRDVFILTLTHDLQVPLVGEHKALEFVVSRPADQPIGKFKGIITDILTSNEGLTALLKKLLYSYNYESGKQKLDLSLQNIADPIDEVIASLKTLSDSKQIIVETQIEENLPSIMMDSEQIKNVLHTILENSITYIQQGGHIIIKSTRQNNTIITCVIDNGPGIPYKTRERIFERYAMAVAIERKIGAGLGLYLARQIIEAHRGKIWYETEIGKGTTFCFTLFIK